MPNVRAILAPDTLLLLQQIAESGSFAAAARQRNMVPSALTYCVRQVEDALDVLLFDRSSRQARLTEAGEELLREGARLLADIDAVAHRVKRVATGWEPQFTIAVDGIIDKLTVMELCEQFYAQNPPTRLRLRDEVLSGTLGALVSGQADLAIGVPMDAGNIAGLGYAPIGSLEFVFAVAPHHPLAKPPEPLTDDLIRQHRSVAVADSIAQGNGVTVGILPGQEVFTVGNPAVKLDAQLRGLGCGYLPSCMAQAYVDTGRLVVKRTERAQRKTSMNYAWRLGGKSVAGKALQWWLEQLKSPSTRTALLGLRGGIGGD